MKTKKRGKLLALALSLVLAFPLSLGLLSGCGDRSEVLKIYNWGEYIADGSDGSADAIEEFTAWYKAHTGKNLTVEYSLFDNNETMYTQIANKRADYDVICPSDYTVQKLRTNGLIVPVNDGAFDTIWKEVFAEEDPEAYGLEADEEITFRAVMNEGLLDKIRLYDDGWTEENGTVYSVPYVWGTFGLLYDDAKIRAAGGENAAADMNSWGALFGDKYAGTIYMKNSVRDAFAAANIYNRTEDLRAASNNFTDYAAPAYREILENCMNYPNDEAIASAEVTLKKQKKNLFAYESDEGKEDLMTGKSTAAMSFVWSCDAGYVIGQEENTELNYAVPVEGTNVWVDGWCIPKYAGNKTAAQYFIAFMSTYRMAYESMYYVGAATPVRQAALDIVEEIENPKALFVADFLDGEEGNENEAEEAWARLVADASDETSATAEESAETLSEYVYFLDKYLENRADCTDEPDCGCVWHAYAKMYAECLQPTDDQVARGAVMTDFAEWNTDIVRMFTRVKGSA